MLFTIYFLCYLIVNAVVLLTIYSMHHTCFLFRTLPFCTSQCRSSSSHTAIHSNILMPRTMKLQGQLYVCYPRPARSLNLSTLHQKSGVVNPASTFFTLPSSYIDGSASLRAKPRKDARTRIRVRYVKILSLPIVVMH